LGVTALFFKDKTTIDTIIIIIRGAMKGGGAGEWTWLYGVSALY
jgi:hypothetical protein